MTTGAIGEPMQEGVLSSSEQQPHRAAYTVLEVAAMLGLSSGNTYALVRNGAIPARRVGGRWIVPKRRFHRWLDERSAR
jgi:excisionase family DNA binding protein